MVAPAAMAVVDLGNGPLLFAHASDNAVLEEGVTSAGKQRARNSCLALPAPGGHGWQGQVEGPDEDKFCQREWRQLRRMQDRR